MFIFLSVICICITTLLVVNSLQKHSITFIIHKKFENINEKYEDPLDNLTDEEKQMLADQKDAIDGMNEVIRLTQEFLGGEVEDADAKRQAE